VDWLRDGTVDLGFVTLPNDEFEAVELARDQMVAIVPADSALALRDRIPPALLSGLPFIMCTGGCESLILDAVRGAPLDVRFRIRDVDTMVGMIDQRMGIAVKPELALPDPLPAGVVCRPLDPPRARRIGLARRRGETNPACRAFVRVAEAEARGAAAG
jgi:DNA-binding transcriptional LysR family regulator